MTPRKGAAPTIEEVLVTAQRRTENLQFVPIAVSVLPPPDIVNSNVITLVQSVSLLPSLTHSGGVEPRNTSIRIRGIGTQSFSLAVEPSVAVIIDGIATGRPGAAAEDIADIDRIEVLRGPQGTLFGKNASVGVVNIVTKDPNPVDFEGYIRAALAEDGESDLRLTASGPLSEHVSYRLNGFHRKWEGVATNVNRNEKTGGIDGSYGARGKLRWARGNGLNATLTLEASSKDSDCCARAGRQLLDENAFLARAGTPVGPENIDVSEDAEVFSKTDSAAASMNLSWNYGGGHALRYLGGYRRWKNSANLDNDSTRFNFVPRQGGTTDSRVLSHELRLESSLDLRWDYVAGLYAFRHEADRAFRDGGCLLSELDEAGFDFEAGLISGCGIEEKTYGAGSFSSTVENSNLAVFGQLNIDLTGKLAALIGFRYLRESLEFRFLRDNPPNGNLGGLLPGKFNAAGKTSDEKAIWKAGAKYQFNDDAMGYITASTGYKGKAYSISQPLTAEILANEPLDPEESINLELGIKSSLFNNRLVINSAIFNTRIDSFQIQGRDPVNQHALLRNAASVETFGAELEFTALPAAPLSLTGGATVLDAGFRKFPDGLCYPGQSPAAGCIGAVQDLGGAAFINAPELKFTISGKYDFRFYEWEAFAEATYTWQDEVQFSPNQDPNRIQKPYGLLHARLGLASPGGMELVLQGNNLTDQFYATDIFRNVDTVGSQDGYYHTFNRDVRRYFGGSIALKF